MNILTFDIEDWWIYEKAGLGDKAEWRKRLDWYLDSILELLNKRGFKATFFVLGKMVECAPDVVLKIDRAGHNIGSHSYSHTFLRNFDYAQAEEDTRKGIDAVEQLIGKKVTAYRAPAFSITPENKYMFEILHKCGIEMDASIFPAGRAFGGFADFHSDNPVIVNYNGVKIKEFPIPMTQVMRKRIAYSGGGYFRLFPYNRIKSIVSQSDYVMTYFHIKDMDAGQMRRYRGLENESAPVRYFKNYYGLKHCFPKFCKLVTAFEFVSLEQADKLFNWNTDQSIIKLD